MKPGPDIRPGGIGEKHMTVERPIIRLRPKKEAAFLNGAPWAYSDQVVLDRRTRAIPAGDLAVLEDSNRTPRALVAVNPGSRIPVRRLDTNPDASIDTDWIAARLSTALSLRDDLYPTPFFRWVHAEADGLPGVIIDRFGDTCAIQPNAAWADQRLDAFCDAVRGVSGVGNIVVNSLGRTRQLEGLETGIHVARGNVSGPIEVPMNGAIYIADLLGGQKTGIYYDQRDNHAFAARLAKGRSVLDVFSHVGGFSLAALAQGAASSLALDGSGPALELAGQGALRSECTDRFETRRGDAFDLMEALRDSGETFGVVICDPPSFAPAKPALEAGLRAYRKVARIAASLVEPGGYLVLCSCSHAADLNSFRQACLAGVSLSGREAKLIATGGAGPDHPVHPFLAESGYLKALFLRLDR